MQLNSNAVPYTLSDVVLYVATLDELYTVNPFTGQISTYITDPTTAGLSEYLGDAAPGTPLYYQDIAMRDDGRLYSFLNAGGSSDTTANNSTYAQFNPGNADTIDNQSPNPFATFVLTPAAPINVNSSPRSFSFTATDNDPGIHFNGMAFSSNTFNTSSTDGRMLYVVGDRSESTATLLVDENPTPTPDDTSDDTEYTVKYITEPQNLLFRLDANTGSPLDQDLYTNTTFHPPQGDVTHVAYNAYPDSTEAHDILAGSGTQVVPRGGLDTQLFLVALKGDDIPDGATFTIDSTSTSLGVATHETPITFEFDKNGSVTAGNTPIVVTNGESQSAVAAAIVKAINDAAVPRPFGDPLLSFSVSAAVQQSGGQLGSVVKLTGSKFVSVDAAFTTDSQLEAFTSTGSNPSTSIFDLGLGQGDITGLAFSGADTSFPSLFAVGDTGGFYRVIGKNTSSGFLDDYELDNNATLQLLNVVTDPVFGGPVRFTGLTNGPANVEQGRYANILFATDDLGRIWAFDENGKPAPIFVNGQTWVSTVPIEALGRTGFFDRLRRSGVLLARQ